MLKADSIAVSGKLPALNAGESYEITYQVEESGFTESNFTANGKNTAYAKVTEKVKDEHSSEPTIYYGIPNLNKNGNYDAENNKVNWTIEVNNNFASLEGYEVSDILLPVSYTHLDVYKRQGEYYGYPDYYTILQRIGPGQTSGTFEYVN